MISVDCTDCMIAEPYPYEREWSKQWYSSKFKGPGLRYEVGISILHGDIIWINGPFACGQWPDIKIFLKGGLKDNLAEGERVEADDGYISADPQYIKSRSGIFHPELGQNTRNTLRARQETVNKRMKQFGALSGIFRHTIDKHGDVFDAVALVTQVAIENGEPLFEVTGYDDKVFRQDN